MADLPQPESYEQLLSDMLSAYAAKVGINDFNVGSAVTSFFEVVALSTARASGDVFQILRDFSVDRATGEALQRLAIENNVPVIGASPATGTVTVTDITFNKIFTKIYAGTNPPNTGSNEINISDGSQLPSTGSVYIGRGTPNVEGPLPYTSVTQNGGYYILTLTNPTAKFHNIGETVILAQGGNRTVPANAIVISPAAGAAADIPYSVTANAVILDGEVSVAGVQVSAQTPGSSGNVPAGAIKQFASTPFSGATVTNALPYTTGTDSDTDDVLRVRIKNAIASTGLGTATAVKAAVIGAKASDENATIVSDSLVTSTTGATLFIDDGTGYEAKTAGVGIESIVDSALGGEQYFQLATGGRQAPVAKAFLISTLAAPFDLIGGDTLAITVGEITYQHVFATSDFRSPGGATAYEVTASINGDTALGFEATTSGGGTYVVIRAIAETNDSVQIATPTTSGRNAAIQMGFPSNQSQTLRLYKNNKPLSKDGNAATVFTQDQTLWSSGIANGDTLILAIDGTTPITFTVNDTDFIATGLYASVAATNSLASWQQVLNSKLTGVTVSIVGSQLELTSNLGASNRASLSISSSSTLVTKGMFSTVIGLSSQGKASDFILDRNTAQFQLVTPLVAGDKLAAGTSSTEAKISSIQIPAGSLTLTSDAHVWMLVDANGTIIPTGISGNSVLSVTTPSSNIIRYGSSVSTAFANVQIGDYVIVWSAEIDASVRLEGRVYAVTNTTLDLLVTPAEYASAVGTTGVTYNQGFVVIRTENVPQKFRVQAGTKTLDVIAQELQTQSKGVTFNVFEEEFLIATTDTPDTSGALLIVTSDAQGALLGFVSNTSSTSEDSLIAYYSSGDVQGQLPLFIHAMVASGSAANPIDSYLNTFTSAISLAGRDPNELITFLQPYGAIADAQPYKEQVQETSINTTTIGIANENNIRRLRSVDRFYLANPLDFGYQDTAVVVLDDNASSESFQIPFYRKAVTNTGFSSSNYSFNAYDVDSGTSANFSSAFPNFDFSNFKVLMQAKKVLKPTPIKTAILYRSVPWGRSGEKINVSYVYPAVPNSPISSTVVVTDVVTIQINLASAATISTSINASTQWNVSITPNTPVSGIDQVTYTWTGTGTAPGLGSLNGGEYVNINQSTGFLPTNIGTFRVSTQTGFTPTATSFTVQTPTGQAIAQTNALTIVASGMSFYNNSSTTAAAVQAYVTANLSKYITATLVVDGDSSGSGVIALSTYEDSGFQTKNVYLLDGINWLANSNLSSSPQFTFKTPLTLPTDVGYAFNNGEGIRFIPTTIDQAARLISILAVTGFTTVGTVDIVDRGSRLELATDTLGSSGSIQIIGGTGNEYSVAVSGAATRLDNVNMQISANTVASQGVASDQWFRLQASSAQAKQALFSSNTSVTTINNDPTTNQSKITFLNQALNQRYLGRPRHHVRVNTNTFRVEKQGALACISWNGIGTSPSYLQSTVNFNDAGGATININPVTGSSEVDYIILTGNTNFTAIQIGDLVTVSGLAVTANNGTYLVTGVSANGSTLRVLNPKSVAQYSNGTFTFTGNSTAGDSFTVGGNTFVAGTNFVIGSSSQATAINLASVIATIPNISASANGNVITITAQYASATIALSYTGSSVVTVSGSVLSGISAPQGTFTASTQVSEGDTVIISAPFSILNQGKYRVIRRYNDSIWIENANVIEEEVTLPANTINLEFDSSSSFMVNANTHSFYLTWNGTGTEPHLENAQVGDVITVGTDFNSANQGQFMVIESGAKQGQVNSFVAPTGGQFASSGAGQYFTLNNGGNLNTYYVWFNVNSANTDPAPAGLTGIEVDVLNGDNSTIVAAKLAAAINGHATALTATSSANTVITTAATPAITADPTNVNVPSPFTITVLQEGRRTFLQCINPSAVNQASVTVSTGVLTCARPQILFYEYEATVPGDQIVVTGSVLTTANAGTYNIVQVLDRFNVIVQGSLASVANVSMNGLESSIFIQEGIPYYGYKHVLLVAAQPGTTNLNYIDFDTNAQYAKINQSAGVNLTSLSKLNFSITIRNGLDSYSYNTGLIAEANRIIYGDPRDPVTYPGVGAAGAQIFIREPLALRIQVGVAIRLNTGVSFAAIASQVRSSVSSLINSNPVGSSIAISSIVSVVEAVSGIKSVAISSPTYDVNDDIIVLTPSQKAIIVDPSIDINVSQIGQ